MLFLIFGLCFKAAAFLYAGASFIQGAFDFRSKIKSIDLAVCILLALSMSFLGDLLLAYCVVDALYTIEAAVSL